LHPIRAPYKKKFVSLQQRKRLNNESRKMDTNTIKGFSCLKMKEEIQAKIYEEIKDMTTEERVAYYNLARKRKELA